MDRLNYITTHVQMNIATNIQFYFQGRPITPHQNLLVGSTLSYLATWLCIKMCDHVSWYILMIIMHHWLCRMNYDMYQDVWSCTTMYSHVTGCMILYHEVWLRMMVMCQDEWSCILLCGDVYSCIMMHDHVSGSADHIDHNSSKHQHGNQQAYAF